MNAIPKKAKLITISGISDREGNAASPPTMNAIVNRIGAVIREMGLSAQIRIEEETLRGGIKKRHRTPSNPRGRRRKIRSRATMQVPLRTSMTEGDVVAPSTTVPGDR